MNDIIFQKQNGGIGRTSVSEDPISGLIMRVPGIDASGLAASGFDTLSTGANSLLVYKLSYPEKLEELGIVEVEMPVASAANIISIKDAAARNAIVYHVSEFFDKSENGTLYLMIKTGDADVTASEIMQLQYYASGSIRQIGVFTKTIVNLSDYQQAADMLSAEHQPLSIVIAYCGIKDFINATTGDVETSSEFVPTTLSSLAGSTANVLKGRCNVSLIVGCELDATHCNKLAHYAYYGAIGTLLGCVSNASVNESIAWVQKFPLGMTLPGFITGDTLSEVDRAFLDMIDANRYIFVRTHVGDADNYFNDSHTLDVATSDYAYIENVRTMDKAVRGIRVNLLPYLNSPLYVDPETGKLQKYVIDNLCNEGNRALEAMEMAGELSGYKVSIDADQNVLSSSKLEIVIKNVPTGVMRKVYVKIGFTTKIN